MRWGKMTVVGAGLLGGSLGLAAKRRGLAGCVEAYVRREASIGECESLGVVDRATCDLKSAVDGADLIVLCTPVGQMAELSRQMRDFVAPGAIITDVGSVKRTVIEALRPLWAEAGAAFIGSHPMAGAEKSGVAWARPDLFEGATCVVTPEPGDSPETIEEVESLWRTVGGQVLRMPAAVHDELVARCSHLPHVLAAALARYVLSSDHPSEQQTLCATGFHDTTRLASGSPEMWKDIALANCDPILAATEDFIRELTQFKAALVRKDVGAILEFFAEARERRDNWLGRSHSKDAPSSSACAK